MKTVINVSRWVVGILFIFSGLVKANDPMGLSYKMQEFFEIWGWSFLDDYTLAFSLLMIGFEIIAGVAVLVGWQFRLFSWLLFMLIVFFTFLTGYAVLSGKIRECGCFGDCIPLTANQSFIKDLILFALISLLVIKRSTVSNFLNNNLSIQLLALSTVFSFGLQYYVLQHQPIVDCLPYKVGKNILEEMKIPAGAIPDSTVITFVYNKGGQEIEFDASHFPDDFNDSAYVFVKRYDKLVREGNAKPKIKDFVIISPSGTDTTQAILNDPSEQLILFAKTIEDDHPEWLSAIKKWDEKHTDGQPNMIAVTSDADRLQSLFQKEGIDVPVYKGDLVAIKTAARTNPALYRIIQGVIVAKYGKADLPDALR